MRDTHRERERQKHRQREKQAPCREPDTGLDPGTPGLCPEPKADARPLSHPGIPKDFIYLFEEGWRESEADSTLSTAQLRDQSHNHEIMT